MLRNGLLTQHQIIEVNGVCVVGLSDRHGDIMHVGANQKALDDSEPFRQVCVTP